MGRSVALAGFASATREGVYSSKADEIWSLNMLHSSKSLRRIFPLDITRLFELHPKWMIQKKWYSTGDHWGWLTRIKHHYPVYLIEEYPEVHNGVRYPLEKVSEKFLGNYYRAGEHLQYYTSSMAYMIALAAYEGFNQIEIYGFEMGSSTEYVYQKACAEFWIGIAGQHSRVVLPENSQLLKSKLYGFEGGQLVPPELLNDYRMDYMAQMDICNMPPLNSDKWILGNLIEGAITLIDEIVAQGDSISRQILEGYKTKFGHAAAKLNHEINTFNAQSWDKDDASKEPYFEKAFESYKYMLRYDGAYQLVCKLIEELDLQTPDKALLNRYRFHPFSKLNINQEVVDGAYK